MKLLPIIGGLVLVAIILGSVLVGGYNRMVTLDETADQSWAEVENQLQRRYDLIPNLVETVKGVAAQEKDVFVGVAEARNMYGKAGTVNEKVAASGMLERALGRLIAVREAYPQLKSNESFLKLQDQLEGTENRLTVARGRYNETAKALNTAVRRLPGSFYASLAGVDKRDYFEISDPAANNAPAIDFGS